MSVDPKLDGVEHLNVYSKSTSELGRFLSNFAFAPVTTEDGPFDSIEGYWYWLGTDNPDRERLRTLSGFRAKEVGRELRAADWQDSDEFKRKITSAIEAKVRKYKRMAVLFSQSELPLRHYYIYGGKDGNPSKVIEPGEGRWIIAFLTDLRGRLAAEAAE